jgi:hypothetical protein
VPIQYNTVVVAYKKNSIFPLYSLFARLISHQPAVLFSQNEPAISNQSAVLFSQNKPAPDISHQPTEQADSSLFAILYVVEDK